MMVPYNMNTKLEFKNNLGLPFRTVFGEVSSPHINTLESENPATD